MTTETVLTDDEIDRLRRQTPETVWGYDVNGFGRAIEQAVLQSPEVQAWKKDAERYRWLIKQHWAQSEIEFRLSITASRDHFGCSESEMGHAISAAMEKQS